MEQNLNKLICDILHDINFNISEQIEMCYNRIQTSYRKKLADAGKSKLKDELCYIKRYIQKLYSKSNKNWNNTKRNYPDYFNKDFIVPDDYFQLPDQQDPFLIDDADSGDDIEDANDSETDSADEQCLPDPETATSSKSIKRKSFDDLSDRQKRRRLKKDETNLEETGGTLISILKLAQRLSQQQGKIEGVKILKKFIKACERDEDFPITLSSKPKQLDKDVAVGIMAYGNLSQNQYINIQQVVKRECANVLPPVNKLKLAKEACYPENLEVNDMKASVPVKDLAFHTTKRIIDANKEEIYEKIKDLPTSSSAKSVRAEMIVTWGMDGTTAQSKYNQAKNSTDNRTVKDDSLITVSMSMHQLTFKDENKNDLCLWDNEKSQSVFSVRPIQLEFEKETKEVVKDIYKNIDSQIAKLGSEKFLCEDMILEVSYKFYPTMMDGKDYTYITDTSANCVCQCCGATPNEMSDIKNLENGRFTKEDKNFKKENLKFNLQPLHTTSNVVKHLYEMSFRKKVMKHWKSLTEAEEKLIAQETTEVKEKMWNAFKVRINEPRQGGVGTSDTGNIARRVLNNPKLLAKTLDLDEELIKRVSNILTKIRSHNRVKSLKAFKEYCTKTYKMFLTLYPWYKVPVSLHRMLAHGSDYMEALPLPIGRMSEEGGESQNKLLRNDRELRARKTSRKDNLMDVIHKRYITSDPVILKKFTKARDKKSRRRNAQEEVEIDEVEIELEEPEGEGYDEFRYEDEDLSEYFPEEESDK